MGSRLCKLNSKLVLCEIHVLASLFSIARNHIYGYFVPWRIAWEYSVIYQVLEVTRHYVARAAKLLHRLFKAVQTSRVWPRCPLLYSYQ